jgi:hypothetical protein
MKKIFVIALVLVGCRKVYDTPSAPSMPTSIGSFNVSPNPSNGLINMTFHLEPNQKYSLLITDMSNKTYKSYGISSPDEKFIKTENLSTFPNGSYDLILMDMNGKLSKTPILIKK